MLKAIRRRNGSAIHGFIRPPGRRRISRGQRGVSRSLEYRTGNQHTIEPQPHFSPQVSGEATQTHLDTRHATEGTAGAPGTNPKSPTKRNAEGTPRSGAAAEGW